MKKGSSIILFLVLLIAVVAGPAMATITAQIIDNCISNVLYCG